jgi:hypothetical protein
MTELSRQQDHILELLQRLDWPTTTSRKNVLNPGEDRYHGFALGIVTSWAGKGDKAGYRKVISLKTEKPKYKGLYEESKRLMTLKDPHFEYSSIQYNKNHVCAKHKDKLNRGYSYIIGLGNYTGGELILYDEEGENPRLIDIRDKFFKFDGSIYPHETAPFTGERITLVFFSTVH